MDFNLTLSSHSFLLLLFFGNITHGTDKWHKNMNVYVMLQHAKTHKLNTQSQDCFDVNQKQIFPFGIYELKKKK